MDAEWLYIAIVAAIVMAAAFWGARRYLSAHARRKQARFRALAHDKFMHYRFRSDQPKLEFRGDEAVVVFKREDFITKNGKEEATFIYLSRNAFDEYFFCVIDLGLSMVHLPRDRALSFLRDFPAEYAAEMEYLFGGSVQAA